MERDRSKARAGKDGNTSSSAEEWRPPKCPVISRICMLHTCFSKMVKKAQSYTKPSLALLGFKHLRPITQ